MEEIIKLILKRLLYNGLLFQGWGENDRGVSFTFGPDVVSKFLNRHDMDLICRAHQVVEDGYEFFAKRQLVTLFSAPNYCGEFDNAGGMMSVDETLMCSFQVIYTYISFVSFSVVNVTLNSSYRIISHCLTDFETVGKESKIPIWRNEHRSNRQTIYTTKESSEKEMTAFY